MIVNDNEYDRICTQAVIVHFKVLLPSECTSILCSVRHLASNPYKTTGNILILTLDMRYFKLICCRTCNVVMHSRKWVKVMFYLHPCNWAPTLRDWERKTIAVMSNVWLKTVNWKQRKAGRGVPSGCALTTRKCSHYKKNMNTYVAADSSQPIRTSNSDVMVVAYIQALSHYDSWPH